MFSMYPDHPCFWASPQDQPPPDLEWSKVTDWDLHCYTRRVKEAIHKRLQPDNINRDSGIEIPEAGKPELTRTMGITIWQWH